MCKWATTKGEKKHMKKEQYKKRLFNVDNTFEKNYEGFIRDINQSPYFEKETVFEMINEDFMSYCYTSTYNNESDTFTLTPNPGFGEEVETYKGFYIVYHGKKIHVYNIGWMWDWAEIDNSNCLERR